MERTDYTFNPLVKQEKHIKIINNGMIKYAVPDGDERMVHIVDAENLETGMVYSYDIPAKTYAGNPIGSITSPDNIPLQGYFKYADEIEHLGIMALTEDGYPPKRLAIYAMMCGKHDLAKNIMQGKDLDI